MNEDVFQANIVTLRDLLIINDVPILIIDDISVFFLNANWLTSFVGKSGFSPDNTRDRNCLENLIDVRFIPKISHK